MSISRFVVQAVLFTALLWHYQCLLNPHCVLTRSVCRDHMRPFQTVCHSPVQTCVPRLILLVANLWAELGFTQCRKHLNITTVVKKDQWNKSLLVVSSASMQNQSLLIGLWHTHTSGRWRRRLHIHRVISQQPIPKTTLQRISNSVKSPWQR